MNILDQIVETTREDLKRRRRMHSISSLESWPLFEEPRRQFTDALRADGMSIIAEIKKASPSKGLIREDFNPPRIAEWYEKGGAAALSVLTEEHHFRGSLDFLAEARIAAGLPLLRKDFVIDPYQVVEARAAGADAVLLIAAILDPSQLHELYAVAREYELAALVEIYDPRELDPLDVDAFDVVGVNNRDLKTFDVDLHRSVEVLNILPDRIVRVSESGIGSAADLNYLLSNGIGAALIGEHLMRAEHPGDELRKWLDELSELQEY